MFSKPIKTAIAAFALAAFLAPTLSISSANAQASKPAVTKKADQKNVKKAAAKKTPAKKADQKAVKKTAAKKTAKKPAKKAGAA
jgi:hypothetical protein